MTQIKSQTSVVYPSISDRRHTKRDRSYYQQRSTTSTYEREGAEAHPLHKDKAEIKLLRRIKIISDFKRIRERRWPDELQPSRETVARAERLWSSISHTVLKVDIDPPRVGPAEDNSIDFFWGNKSERILMNVPDDETELIFIHFINEKGQTIVNFSDSHTFNVVNLVKELRGSLD